MPQKNEESLSAQVVIDPRDPSATGVRDAFTKAGFEVGPLVGNSFSIAATKGSFETYFGTKIVPPGKSLGLAVKETETLPTDPLPESLRKSVKMILFTRPPDFGPTSY